MRGDKKRDSLRRELMDFFPEIAPRLWIDTGGWLIQQQQFRTMNETGTKRKTLFPSTGKLAGELLLAFRESELLHAFTHGLLPVLHIIHARNEIEILFDAQVFPKTESLRHVANFAFDRFALGDHIVAKNPAAAVVSPKQSAEHAQERGLAAAVRPEESVNFAGAYRQIDMIHRGEFTEPLGHPAHLDDGFTVFLVVLNSFS